MGPTDQMLEASVASACAGRSNVAVMSFNPHAVAAMGRLSPDVPRGLTTSAFDPRDWIGLSPDTCNRLRGIPDYNATGSSFVSHQAADLGRARVGELKADGAAILCWTIRSREQEARARTVAHNITFEGYAAPVPTG